MRSISIVLLTSPCPPFCPLPFRAASESWSGSPEAAAAARLEPKLALLVENEGLPGG